MERHELPEPAKRLIGIGEGVGCAVEFALAHLGVEAVLRSLSSSPWIRPVSPVLAALVVCWRYGGPNRVLRIRGAFSRIAAIVAVQAAVSISIVAAERSFSWNSGSPCLSSGFPGLLHVAVIAPIAEEVVFRGVLVRAMSRRGCSLRSKALVSGLAFGAYHAIQLIGGGIGVSVHVTAIQMAFASVIGACIATINESVGSIAPGVILHVSNNAAACPIAVTSIFGLGVGRAVAFAVGMVIEASAFFAVTRGAPFTRPGPPPPPPAKRLPRVPSE